jgi:hypothetical protein
MNINTSTNTNTKNNKNNSNNTNTNSCTIISILDFFYLYDSSVFCDFTIFCLNWLVNFNLFLYFFSVRLERVSIRFRFYTGLGYLLVQVSSAAGFFEV